MSSSEHSERAVTIPVDENVSLAGRAVLQPGALGCVVCHPHPAFGGRMDTPMVVDLFDGLVGAGASAVRFNFRGLDGSTGSPTGGLQEEHDVAAAASWLRGNGASSILLVGYSFGALMGLKAIGQGLAVEAFVAVGFPTTLIANRGPLLEAGLSRKVPSLFVSGDKDQFSELDVLRDWEARHANVALDVLPGRGHFFNIERGRVAGWLSDSRLRK